MDRDSWAALSSEVEPIIKQLCSIAANYKLDDPFTLGIYADGEAYMSMIDRRAEGDYQFDMLVDRNGAVEMKDSSGHSYIKS